jgi:PAS domain-containing protein
MFPPEKSTSITNILSEQLQAEKFAVATQTAFKFISAGVLWIIFSDVIVFLIHAPEPNSFPIFHIEVLKGIVFVVVMGIFIFFLVKKNQQVSQEVDQLDYFRKNPLPMWIYCPDTLRFLEVNAAAVDTYGYSRAEFLSMSLPDIRPVEEVPKLRCALDEIKKGFFFKGTLVHLKKDSTKINAEISAYPIVFNKQNAGLILSYDVSKLFQLEHEVMQLRLNQEKHLNDKLYEVALYNKELQIRIREINATNDELIVVNKLLLDANKNTIDRQTAKQKVRQEKLRHYIERNPSAAWSWSVKDPEERFYNEAALKLFGVKQCIPQTEQDFWRKLVDPFDQPLVEIHLAILEKDDVIEFTYKLAEKDQLIRQRIEVLRDDDEQIVSFEYEAWRVK